MLIITAGKITIPTEGFLLYKISFPVQKTGVCHGDVMN